MPLLTDPKQIVIEVLTIANYKGDKNKIADEFLDVCWKEALISVIQSIPQDQQKTLTEATVNQTPESLQHILEGYVTQEEISKTLQNTAKNLFESFVKTLIPTLTQEQKEQLQHYLSSLQS